MNLASDLIASAQRSLGWQLISYLCVALCALGCSPNSAPQSVWRPTLQFIPCAGADLLGFTSRCARVRLEENGAELSIAVIEPVDASASLPIAYLAGGPGEGGNTTVRLDDWRYWASDIGLKRPLVLWQPRGTLGASNYFECDSFHAWLKQGELGSDNSMRIAMESCFVQWRSQWRGELGFSQFSSRQSARDLKQIMQLLGFHSWHLWASSYGGRTADWLLRDSPSAISSVIFDSAVTSALQRPSDFAHRWALSMEQLFARACALNDCNLQRLMDDFWRAADNIQAIARKSGFDISREVFVHWVFTHGLDDSQVRNLPAMLARFNDAAPLAETFAEIEQFIAAKTAPANDPWIYYATLCADLMPQTHDEFVAETASLGRWQDFWRSSELTSLCPLLGNEATLSELSAASNGYAGPVLFLAGRFDPLIPLRAVQRERLLYSNSLMVVSPDSAHGLLRSRACGDKLAERFWVAPTEFITSAKVHAGDASFGCTID